MYRLVVNPGTPQSEEIQLKPGINSLGRGSHNDFTINDDSVSGSHCEILINEGVAKIKDLGSTNGTFVNQSQIQESWLEDGHAIRLGNVEMSFHASPARELAHAGASRPTRVQWPPAPESSAVVASPTKEENSVSETNSATVSVSPSNVSPALSTSSLRPAGLRLAKETTTPTTVSTTVDEEPALPPSIDEPQSGLRFCKFHPKSHARYLCQKCNRTFCELCVSTRATASKAMKTCRSCGVECLPLQQSVEAPQSRGFYKSLPGAFVYPLRGTGILMIIGGALVFGALNFIAGFFLLLLKMAAIGYVFSYMQNIIHSTAAEDTQMPDFPDTDGLFAGFFSLVGTILMSFGLAIGLAIAKFGFDMEIIPMAAIFAAVIFGCFYFPMAFLATAMKDTAVASNPLIVIPSMMKVPMEYFVTVVLMAAVFGVQKLGDMLSGEATGLVFSTRSASVVVLAFGFKILWSWISLYLLSVNMRILGLLYLTKKEKLGWF